MHRHVVALGLGSNLDTPLDYLREALRQIKKIEHVQVLAASSIYESDAQLPENAPAGWNLTYLNAVILCQVNDQLQPLELLYALKKIEVKMGRLQSERWAPRVIDIDILDWENTTLNEKELKLPHPRLVERPFALLPLLEVIPNYKVKNPPHWLNDWVTEIPFGTQKSKTAFWPRLVAVMNITTDSFSDGGLLLNSDSLLAHAEKILSDGAEIIDIGAESTRPQAAFVSNEVEFKNLKWGLDLLRPLRKKLNFKVSLDCRRPEVVRQILESHRIDYLNDVSGFNSTDMQNLLKSSKAQAFVMHSLSIPADPMNVLEDDENPFDVLEMWWKRKKSALLAAGIHSDRLIFDPGIGFGKTKRQCLYLLKNLSKLAEFKTDVLIGHSRKSFQTLYSDQEASRRDTETALVTKDLNKAYMQYLRVHDVTSQKSALRY